MLLNALQVALVSESFGYLTERPAVRVNGSAANCRFERLDIRADTGT